MPDVTLIQGDCLEVMPTLAPGSVDLVLCDLPYGTTDARWDAVIPFAPLWSEYRRMVRQKAAIALTASQPFTTALIASNLDWFKYCWIWNKAQAGNYGLAKYQPLKITEDVCIFSNGTHSFHPVMRQGKMRKKGGSAKSSETISGLKPGYVTFSDQYYPTNILDFPNCANKAERVHPTQKPVALLEYLIRTYTNEGDTVLDNTMGSGSTGVACMNTGRNFIGIERDPTYFAIAEKRIAEAQKPAAQPMLLAAE